MLLLINIFTDALPAMAMAVEPEDPSVVKGRGNAQSSILSSEVMRGVVVQALISTTLLSIVFFYFLPQGIVIARTAVFTLYLFQKALRAFTARSFTRSVFEYGFFTNRLMNIAIPSVFIAWAVMSYVLPGILGLVRLPFFTVSILFGLATILPISEELTKQWNTRVAQRAVATSTD